MHRHILALLLLASTGTAALAQDTYSNFAMTNTSDIYGSARYVGMGGAMGALGADISAMSNNPAAIGLFTRNDVSLTMGGFWQAATPGASDSRGHFTFDQIGFVTCVDRSDNSGVNIGINLQKKADYNYSLCAQYNGLQGLSQAAQFAGLYGNCVCADYSLPVRVYDALLYDIGYSSDTNVGQRVNPQATDNDFWKCTSGKLYGLDFNISGHVRSRVFWGITMGVDFLTYRHDAQYIEYRNGYNAAGQPSTYDIQDYDLTSHKYVSGAGLNVKAGVIVRPVEESPFRIGVAVETPTWYTLTQRNSTFSIASKWQYNGQVGGLYDYSYLPSGRYATYDSYDDNYLDFNVHAPWRFRVALGSTVGTMLAWDVEYEYALYNHLTTGSPTSFGNNGSASLSMVSDRAMNALTSQTLRGIHNVRAGIEFKPTSEIGVRVGYNYYSAPMQDGARLDQSINSDVMNYMVGTDYMNLGDTNIITCGLGYRGKTFYADLAYKYRLLHGDFYAFDDMYQRGGTSESQFLCTAAGLQATDVDLSRHAITFTLGVKF